MLHMCPQSSKLRRAACVKECTAASRSRISSLFFALLVLVLSAVISIDDGLPFRMVEAHRVTVAFGGATVLSGALGACSPDPYRAACKGGMASLFSFGRMMLKSNRTDTLVMVPDLDTASPLVYMHPAGLSVSTSVFKHVGIDSYTLKASLLGARHSLNYERLYRTDVTPIATNADLSPDDIWSFYLNTRKIYSFDAPEFPRPATIGILYICPSSQLFSAAPVAPLRAAIQSLRRDADFIVVLYQDRVVSGRDALDQLGAGNVPDVMIDVGPITSPFTVAEVEVAANNDTDASAGGPSRTWYCTSVLPSTGTFATLNISFPSPTAAPIFTNISFDQHSVNALPDAGKDAEYYDLQRLLLNVSLDATANDPVLTSTDIAVDASRIQGHYPCYMGECAQGTIVARSLAWRYGTDFAFMNSGGPRGPGWNAGPIRTSSIWALYTFANLPCTGTIMGLKIWEIVNASMAYCPFSYGFETTGDRFLQSFGLQIEYDNDTALTAISNTRVRAIRVRNQTTGLYAPLDRLKYYTFAADSYHCTGMPVIAPILLNLRPGETVTADLNDELVQVSIENFLREHSPVYEPVFQNYLIKTPAEGLAADPANVESVKASFMLWTQTAAMCLPEEYWDPLRVTCIRCEQGFRHDDRDITICVVVQPEQEADHILLYTLIPILSALALVIIIALCLAYWHFASKVRNTRFAPKGGSAAIIFTDVQTSTRLWGTVPQSMGVALDLHHALIRKAIDKHHAYEVKTVGDSFMIAVETAEVAAELALQIQLDFQDALWPRCIDQVYSTQNNYDLDDNIEDDPMDLVGIDSPPTQMEQMIFSVNHAAPPTLEQQSGTNSSGGGASLPSGAGTGTGNYNPLASLNKSTNLPRTNHFIGLRVRIGIHYGPVSAVFDDIAKGYDYYGTTVNAAARLEALGDGGQIIMSRVVRDRLTVDPKRYRIDPLGAAQLRGIEGAVDIFQLTPLRLSGRVFDGVNLGKNARSPNAKVNDAGEETTEDRSSSANKSSEPSVATLTEQELHVQQTLTLSLRPLSQAARAAHLKEMIQAWRVDVPKSIVSNTTKKEAFVLTIIAQRLAAISGVMRSRLAAAAVHPNLLNVGSHHHGGGGLRDLFGGGDTRSRGTASIASVGGNQRANKHNSNNVNNNNGDTFSSHSVQSESKSIPLACCPPPVIVDPLAMRTDGSVMPNADGTPTVAAVAAAENALHRLPPAADTAGTVADGGKVPLPPPPAIDSAGSLNKNPLNFSTTVAPSSHPAMALVAPPRAGAQLPFHSSTGASNTNTAVEPSTFAAPNLLAASGNRGDVDVTSAPIVNPFNL